MINFIILEKNHLLSLFSNKISLFNEKKILNVNLNEHIVIIFDEYFKKNQKKSKKHIVL